MSHIPGTAFHACPQPAAAASTDSTPWSFDWQSAEHAAACRAVSCVIWSSNAAPRLARLLPRVSELLTESGHPWEIIVVDAASSDGTPELLGRWSAIPAVRMMRLAGQDADEALKAGLGAARGDAVVCIDANLNHSVALIPQMISHWEEGAEVVYALSQGLPERSALNWFGTSVFRSLTASDRPLDWLEDCGDLTLLNRRVVVYLNQ